ncbi:MAG: hypothetical protein ACPLRY_08365 [Candidatus Bathyarchaeales archaeon]
MASDELALETLLEFINAIEAGIAAAKQHIKEVKQVYNIEAIKWEKAQGPGGEYERSEDVNSSDFKALLRDVQAHGGKMTVDNYFVWCFKNGAVLGRKLRKSRG